ncbi:UBN2 domain-containing protein [Abeliophyllum distichum]|uniref:UBN2 domain-containing protein n=1 Tax=Abeliophyllum distichum TaxID=126358 RepID=A0ABD1Q5I8_9LAMI
MVTRFTDIVNGLKGFDRKFTNGELVSKMLRSLLDDWSPLMILIENTKDVKTHPLEELYRTLITYELNNAEKKEKTRKSKEEMKKPPKQQNFLKSTNDEGSSSMNISDEELDDLVLLVKKWSGFCSNRRFQKKKKKKVKIRVKRLFAMIVTNSVTKESSVQIRRNSLRRKHSK